FRFRLRFRLPFAFGFWLGVGLWQRSLFLLPLDFLGLELVAVPLLRRGVVDLVLLEVLAPQGDANQILGAADLNAARLLEDLAESLFGRMPLLSFGQQLACGDRLLIPGYGRRIVFLDGLDDLRRKLGVVSIFMCHSILRLFSPPGLKETPRRREISPVILRN